jgi:DNA-binding protein YbaB
MAAYQQEAAALAARAEAAKAQIKALTGTLTSKDGAVTVTVNVAGALQSLSFGARADELPRQQLSALVMSTARRAQAQAAGRITEIMAPLIGENSKAMDFIKEQIPIPEEPEPDLGTSQPQPQVMYNEEQRDAYRTGQPPAGPPLPPMPQRPDIRPGHNPQPRPGRPDDDEFDSGPITRQGDW